MHRRFKGRTLVIASHNAGKIREIAELLAPHGVERVISGPTFHFTEPEEDGDTFLANAAIKSRFFSKHTALPALSDDSGLVVPMLDGAPGIFSARWAGSRKNFTEAMKRVEKELQEKCGTTEGHEAFFVCALSLCWPDGHMENVEGKVKGTLVFPPRGNKGFGYDPIFVPEGYSKTFAEMDPEEKQKISHRALAFEAIVDRCFTEHQPKKKKSAAAKVSRPAKAKNPAKKRA